MAFGNSLRGLNAIRAGARLLSVEVLLPLPISGSMMFWVFDLAWNIIIVSRILGLVPVQHVLVRRTIRMLSSATTRFESRR